MLLNVPNYVIERAEMKANAICAAAAPENTNTNNWEVVGLNDNVLFTNELNIVCKDFIADYKEKAIYKALNINQ